MRGLSSLNLRKIKVQTKILKYAKKYGLKEKIELKNLQIKSGKRYSPALVKFIALNFEY